jgi:Icc-related predicted phosphoesterase
MSSEHVNRILCASRPSGAVEGIKRLLEVAAESGAQAIALVGDLGNGLEGPRQLFHALGRAEQPVYWVPGQADAPAGRYLRESHNIEVACPQLRGVHGTVSFAADGLVAFAGMGGAISDDPDVPRDEDKSLRYPRWEAAYRLKVVTVVDYNELVMLFATPPAHKGRNLPGSDAVAELIGTYRPRLVVTGGEAQITEIGRSLIVAPGSLAEESYAVADLHARTAEFGHTAVPSR